MFVFDFEEFLNLIDIARANLLVYIFIEHHFDTFIQSLTWTGTIIAVSSAYRWLTRILVGVLVRVACTGQHRSLMR